MATYKHLRSSTANKRPTTTIADGQLAINTNTASPGLFFKDSAGTGIVKVGPVHVGTTAPNSVPASGGSTGNYTGEQWLDTSVSPAQMKVWNGSTWVGIVADELPVSKLQDGAARQLIQTDAAGTGVEWTSNVDVPGTLDVTSTATFDSIAQYPLGSAAAPTLTFTGDNNTGIYSPGADQVAISTNSSQRLLIDSSGNVGVGTTIASTKLDVAGELTFSAGGAGWRTASLKGIDEGGSFQGSLAFYTHPNAGAGGAPTEKMRLTSAGRLGLGTSSPGTKLQVNEVDGTDAIRILDSVGSVHQLNLSTGSITASRTSGSNGGLTIGTANQTWGATGGFLALNTNGNTRLHITSGGSVGIGTTAPLSRLHVNTGTNENIRLNSSELSAGGPQIGAINDASNAYVNLTLNGSNILFGNGSSERGRWDSSGRLLVGTSSVSNTNVTAAFQGSPASSANAPLVLFKRNTATPGDGDSLGSWAGSDNTDTPCTLITTRRDGGTWSASSKPSRLEFSTTADGASSPTERMRITSGGDIHTAGRTSASLSTTGCTLEANGAIWAVRSGGTVGVVNRRTDDGNLIEFYQADTLEGAISVSGTTVTYGGGHLARWSQLPNEEDPSDLLKGTVMSNLDEMCEWGEEDNEQLNKTKVSDVEGDPNVAGVFVSTSISDDGPLDFFVAMTGDMIIRIAEGVTVERGDLLMSAGDGTAKPQDDDIIRSKTIAKVTSTNVSCTYDDGSYCVPCVLTAC
jgi:hypothetical protein